MFENCLGCGVPIEEGEYCNECLKERMVIKDKPRGYHG